MYRRVFLQSVGDMQANVLAFLEPDSRTRNRSIDGDCVPRPAVNRDLAMGDPQVDVCAGKGLGFDGSSNGLLRPCAAA